MPEETIAITTSETPPETTTETVNVDGLKSALAKERQARADAEKQARDLAKWKADQEKAVADAAAETARKNGEWETLAQSEKARADAAEAKTALIETATRTRLARMAVKDAAGRMSAAYPDDVYAMLTASGADFAYDDDGMPTNADALVKAFLDSRPLLVTQPTTVGSARIPATARGYGATPTQEQEIERAKRELIQSGNYPRF